MVTGILPRKGLRAAVCGICLGIAQTAVADSVLTSFAFDDETGDFTNMADIVAAGLDVSAWYTATGSVADFAGVEGRALAARNFASGNALVLDITVAHGFSLDLGAVAFDHVASASGPTQWMLHIDGADILGGATPSSFERIDDTFALGPFSGALRIELRGLGASSNSGTYRVDNFTLSGNVAPVPLPGALVLAASAAGLLPLVGRRAVHSRIRRRRIAVSPFPPLVE